MLGSIDIIFSIPYPDLYRQILAWFALFELDVFKFLPLGCVMDVHFYKVLVVRTSFPLVLIGGLALAGWARQAQASRRMSARHAHGGDFGLSDTGLGSSIFNWCTHRT